MSLPMPESQQTHAIRSTRRMRFANGARTSSHFECSERGTLGFVSLDDLTENPALEREVRMQDRLALWPAGLRLS